MKKLCEQSQSEFMVHSVPAWSVAAAAAPLA